MIKKMTDKDYFSIDAISNSKLSAFNRCPANLFVEKDNTPQMSLGTLAHAMILEGPRVFQERFVAVPKVDRRTKEGKAAWEEALASAGNKTLVTVEDLQLVAGMAESVKNHPFARELVTGGKEEIAVTWDIEGVNCKAKIDYLKTTLNGIPMNVLVDLKTTQSADIRKFGNKTIFDSGYDRQMAFYNDGLVQNMYAPQAVYIVAVENTAPFTCNVFDMSECLERGRNRYMRIFKDYVTCKNSNTFPSYQYAGAYVVKPPAWMQDEG